MKNNYRSHGPVTEVFLTHKGDNYISLFDTEDMHLIDRFSWSLGFVSFRHPYVMNSQNRVTTYAHRLITDCPDGLVVDHLSTITLDNRKSNLESVTARENLKRRWEREKLKSTLDDLRRQQKRLKALNN